MYNSVLVDMELAQNHLSGNATYQALGVICDLVTKESTRAAANH